jgi:hypothetical protein
MRIATQCVQVHAGVGALPLIILADHSINEPERLSQHALPRVQLINGMVVATQSLLLGSFGLHFREIRADHTWLIWVYAFIIYFYNCSIGNSGVIKKNLFLRFSYILSIYLLFSRGWWSLSLQRCLCVPRSILTCFEYFHCYKPRAQCMDVLSKAWCMFVPC